MINIYLWIKLLNIRATTSDFLVIVSIFVRQRVSYCACVAWSWHKLSQGKSKLTQSKALTVKLLKLQSPFSLILERTLAISKNITFSLLHLQLLIR